MADSNFVCPFCGKESQEVEREVGKIVTYECSLCGSLTAAYLEEFHSLLRDFFKRYHMNEFKDAYTARLD